ncbi:MAG TPA: hypothetical protein VK395_03065 [Gemmataceae bacterium]|nr:hypothetical protein [Gemmataceae bacterium]
MAPRRKLAEGLKADPAVEDEFVRTGRVKATPPGSPPAEATPPREAKGQATKPLSRAPLTTRIRSDFSTALKRASLERQLNGVLPNTLQAILEEALEPWLRKHGYL